MHARILAHTETRVGDGGAYHFVGADLRRRLDEVGLDEADEGGDVARPLPQDGQQEVREEGHVAARGAVGVHLEEEGEQLEDVRDELCREGGGRTRHIGRTLQLISTHSAGSGNPCTKSTRHHLCHSIDHLD